MPTSSSAAPVEKKRSLKSQPHAKSVERPDNDSFLTIESALPPHEPKKLIKRSHSTLSAASLTRDPNLFQSDPVILQTHPDGSIHISRTKDEKQSNPDRISLDRRGLTGFPVIDGDIKIRLLSLQHNLITNLDGLKAQNFPFLVFLDVYDNQLESLGCLGALDNLRVLLVGKNRLRKIEGIHGLKRIEVLDLHGNQISHVTGLGALSELKVLNLAGNQLRYVGAHDFQGLEALQELNLRRNRLRKLAGFGETPSLVKLFLSNNDIHSVDDMSSLAKASNLREISIDNNPVFLSGDCVSFLVSYLPLLTKLNTMQINDQVRKAAMAWRRNKESTNTAFMDLTSDVCLNVRREEIISNARTNWELLRTQTKCLTAKPTTSLPKTFDLSLDSDLILTSLNKPKPMPLFPRKLRRTSSQDTENSHTSSSNTSSSDFVRLPPILVPIIKRMEQRPENPSLSSVGPNVDSSVSSLASENESSSTSASEAEEPVAQKETETSSNLSCVTLPSTSSSEPSMRDKRRGVKSAVSNRGSGPKLQRAATARVKALPSPAPPPSKDREQGGDYLIEICGRYLNVYGQCALRFIDKSWSQSKANDVTTIKFHYINFNSISGVLSKIKIRFPHVEHLIFKETNIHCLGQINALADVQGLTSLQIDAEGNPITFKQWRSYAIYRLSHWGLSSINDKAITEDEVKSSNREFQSLSDLVLWSLPDVLLQPLLVRLRLDVSCGVNVKKWLLKADPSLRGVVSKEALQWKKGPSVQEDAVLRQKAKVYMSTLLDEMGNSVNKLRLLDKKWPSILHEFVRNALLDYSQLDMYMKRKMLELD